MACAALLAGLVLAVLASNAAAGSVDCTATLYQKTFFGGETFNISLLASGTPAKTVVYDLAKVPPAANGKSWDDILNSVRLLCTCTMGDCSADYPLLLLRVFAEPQYRMHNGGDNFTMACTASADGASCSNSRTAMPAGWGSRTSAVAVLYDMSAYVLPLKIVKETSPSPSQSTSPAPSPSPSPSPTPSPSPSPEPSPSPSPKPSPSPSPMPSQSPSPKPSSPMPSPKASAPSPKPSPKRRPKSGSPSKRHPPKGL